jgi:hypothetical protein
MSDVTQIELGRQAWQRLQSHQRTAWADWLEVGKAIKIGKDAALKAAGVKTPFGKPYVRMFGAWLRDNRLDEIRSAHRYRLLMCIENIVEIEAWRAGLDEATRNKFNHPDAVWFAWRRAVHKEPPNYTRPYRPPNHQSGKHVGGRSSRLVHFNQDMVRRAAMAMRENFSNDVYALARICLMAAIRNKNDLLDLLPPEPKPAPRRSTTIIAPAALELSA